MVQVFPPARLESAVHAAAPRAQEDRRPRHAGSAGAGVALAAFAHLAAFAQCLLRLCDSTCPRPLGAGVMADARVGIATAGMLLLFDCAVLPPPEAETDRGDDADTSIPCSEIPAEIPRATSWPRAS